jgi:hypothetical protein
MAGRLLTVDACKAEAVAARRLRAAAVATGVACPGKRGKGCGREVQKARPRLTTRDGELLWVWCVCPKCGHTLWLPEA